MNLIRASVIRLYDALLNDEDRDQFKAYYAEAGRLVYQHGKFDLNYVAFGVFISLLATPEFYRQRDSLTDFKDKLLGKTLYWNTRVFQHNFSKLLTDREREIYSKVNDLLALLKSFLDNPYLAIDQREEYQNLRHIIYEKVDQELKLNTVAQFLLSQMEHVLMNLNVRGLLAFAVSESGFMTVYSPAALEMIESQLQYVEALMQKFEGKATLFIDVSFTSEGYLLNLR